MITLKIDLIPKNNIPLPIDYTKYLDNVCFHLLKDRNSKFKIETKISDSYSAEKTKWLFTYSKLNCTKYEVNGNYITFKSKITWHISSPVYELILHLVQKLFTDSIIKIGESEFEAIGLGISEELEIKSKKHFKLLHSTWLENINNFNYDKAVNN